MLVKTWRPIHIQYIRTTGHGQRTTHDDGRQTIAIGHLSNSGYLKTYILTMIKRFLNLLS